MRKKERKTAIHQTRNKRNHTRRFRKKSKNRRTRSKSLREYNIKKETWIKERINKEAAKGTNKNKKRKGKNIFTWGEESDKREGNKQEKTRTGESIDNKMASGINIHKVSHASHKRTPPPTHTHIHVWFQHSQRRGTARHGCLKLLSWPDALRGSPADLIHRLTDRLIDLLKAWATD